MLVEGVCDVGEHLISTVILFVGPPVLLRTMVVC